MNEPPPPSSFASTNSSLAVWSLVLGILSLVCLGLLAGIPAVICGHTAQSRIRKSAGALSGGGLALAGLITGYIGTALSILILPLLLAIAIPNFVRARDVAQKNMCVNNLRVIQSAKEQWALENKKADIDVPAATNLDKYIAGGFRGLHCPKDGAYNINAVGKMPMCSTPGHNLRDAY